eukprot:1176865-Prorocentrum_minimum.AAC.5
MVWWYRKCPIFREGPGFKSECTAIEPKGSGGGLEGLRRGRRVSQGSRARPLPWSEREETEADGTFFGTLQKFHTVMAMPEYKTKCSEELR